METDNASSLSYPKNHLFFALDEEIQVYGMPVTGVIALVVQKKEAKVKNIKIRWEGREHTSWYSGSVTGSNHNTDSRIIFSKVQTVFTNPSTTLSKGTHTWPFSWDLPANLPGSFRDVMPESTGPLSGIRNLFPNLVVPEGGLVPRALIGEPSSIIYTAVAFIEEEELPETSPEKEEEKDEKKEGKVKEKEMKMGPAVGIYMRVVQRFDPETVNLTPISKEDSRMTLFSQVPVRLKVTVPRGGIAFRGHRMPLKVEIVNGSSRKIEGIGITINQVTIVNSKGESLQRKTSQVAGYVKDGIVEPQAFYVKDVFVDIPYNMEPSITLGTLIKRYYEITVDMSVPMAISGISLAFPLQIYEPFYQFETDKKFLANFLPLSVPIPVEAPPSVTQSPEVVRSASASSSDPSGSQSDASSITSLTEPNTSSSPVPVASPSVTSSAPSVTSSDSTSNPSVTSSQHPSSDTLADVESPSAQLLK